ncbi:unnamed protein product [Ectocarpus sp. 6 AP-2014]
MIALCNLSSCTSRVSTDFCMASTLRSITFSRCSRKSLFWSALVLSRRSRNSFMCSTVVIFFLSSSLTVSSRRGSSRNLSNSSAAIPSGCALSMSSSLMRRSHFESSV